MRENTVFPTSLCPNVSNCVHPMGVVREESRNSPPDLDIGEHGRPYTPLTKRTQLFAARHHSARLLGY
jgi:hypothetical protein